MENYRLIFVFIILLCGGSLCVDAQTNWDYPSNPGSPEWRSLKMMADIIAAQQIPENVLKKMSTDELFQAWSKLPGRIDILAFNTLQEGFDIMVKRYNVVPELLNRENIGEILLQKYFQTNPYDIREDWSNLQKGKWITDMGFLEFLLSQPVVLEKLTTVQKRHLVDQIIANHAKKQMPKGYNRDPFWEDTGIILLGRMLRHEKYLGFVQRLSLDANLKIDIESGELLMSSRNIQEDILNMAQDFLSN